MTRPDTRPLDTGRNDMHTLRFPGRNGDTMSTAITSHLTSLRLRGLSPAYIGARRRVLRDLTAALPVPLLDATPGMLAEWRAAMTHTPAVVCGYCSHARGFYAWATRTGLIPASPAADIPVPRKPRRLPRPISERDLATALDAAPPVIRAWIVLAAWCGLRCKEIAYLKAENIHLTASTPYILVSAESTKGGQREHVVELCDFAAAELAAAGIPARGWAFRRADGRHGPNQPHRVSQAVNGFLRDCGIRATAHQGRHRFATEALRHTNLRVVQELLGHADISSTAIYTEVSSESRLAAVRALPIPAAGRLRKAS